MINIVELCQRWKRVSDVMSLWKEIDLRPYELLLDELDCIAWRRFTPHLATLRLQASFRLDFCKSTSSQENLKKYTLLTEQQ